MAKRGENIYLRKDGRWEGRYIKGRKQDGKPRFGYVYAQKYVEVKKELTIYKAQYAEKPDIVLLYGKGKLEEWLWYWLENLVRPYIGETTYETYKSQMQKHILPELGGSQIRALSQEQIQCWINTKKETLSAGMVHNICRLLRSALLAAQEKRLIAQNPCTGLKLPKNAGKKPRVLSLKEQQKLERAALRDGALEYLLCLYTGLRLGEVCALQWQDVDFTNGSIHVRRALKRVGRAVTLGSTKSGCSKREVPVPAFVRKRLAARMERRGNAEFVFGNGTKPASMRTMQARLKTLAKRVGLRGVHMHTLRHTYAARCLEQMIGVETLSELLGHSGPEITLKYYAHCTRENKFASVQRLKKIA